MNYQIITDSIAGLVAADKISESQNQVNIYIPNNANFNGFRSKNKNIGSRLIELHYQEHKNFSRNLSEYKQEYKGHSTFMNTIGPYIQNLFDDELIEVNDPELVINNQVYKDFLYGDYFQDLLLFLESSRDLSVKKSSFEKIQNKEQYNRYIQKYNNYLELSRTLHPHSVHNLIKSILDKLNKNYTIQSKYHRVLWLPILWDSTINKIFEKKENIISDSKFYKPKNDNFNFVEKLVQQLNAKENININYFDKTEFKIERNQIYIRDKKFCDNKNLILSINMNFFSNLFKDIETTDVCEWNFKFYYIKTIHLLKNFSQISFADSSYPYRVSYSKSDNEILSICVENGLGDNSNLEVFKFLVNKKYLSENSLINLTEESNLKIPFSMPTIRNEKIYNLKINKISEIFNECIKLAPLNFYQSSALNEQIAQGLSIDANLK